MFLLSVYTFNNFLHFLHAYRYIHRYILTMHSLENDRILVETSYFTVNFYSKKSVLLYGWFKLPSASVQFRREFRRWNNFHLKVVSLDIFTTTSVSSTLTYSIYNWSISEKERNMQSQLKCFFAFYTQHSESMILNIPSPTKHLHFVCCRHCALKLALFKITFVFRSSKEIQTETAL